MTNANVFKCAEIQHKIGPKTQLQYVMDHLKLKGSITQMEAYNLYRVTRLTSRIHDLKRMGLDIAAERKKDMNGTVYVKYYLL